VDRIRTAIHGPHRLVLTVLLSGLLVLGAVSSGTARSRPTCFGKPATIVGGNGSNKISGTPYDDVIVARGGNDVIEAQGRANHGRDLICGGEGKDEIEGSGDAEKISGGPGNDRINGGHGNDLIVGDNYGAVTDSGGTGRDHIEGGFDRDFIVGDNLARGDASGQSPDWIGGNAGGDKIVGDSASLRGDATGGASDHVAGATGDDIVIGDSYAAHGTARGSGDDSHTTANNKASVDGGPGEDLLVGDDYTVNGTTIGGGKDAIHSADGGDAGAKCHGHECDDVQYGDSYAASCGRGHDIKTIHCQDAATSGGGFDLLTSDQGSDFMNGGLPNNLDVRGKRRDRCNGGSGHDVSVHCEYNYRNVEKRIQLP
jgi:Ca2+-binding RTX toxin-like protein